jgi:hypothetical protein
MRQTLALAMLVGATLCATARVQADTTVTTDPGAPWLGFMNVFELPSNGGGFVFNSGWGTADLVATFSGDVLSLSPNTIGDPDPFWYIGGGGPGAPGNKIMEANMYQEVTGPLAGQTVTFTANVLSNTLTSAHTSRAFIRDFAPDYSSFNESTVALTPGVFSISLATLNDPARHVQFGFQTKGVNVWITDVGPFGSVQIAPVPEPATFTMFGVALIGVAGLRRRRVN